MKITRNHPYDTGHGRIFLCRGCTNPFKSRNTLQAHESVCPNMKMGKAPFSKLMPLNPPTTVEESVDKDIVLTQPLMDLPPTQPEENNTVEKVIVPSQSDVHEQTNQNQIPLFDLPLSQPERLPEMAADTNAANWRNASFKPDICKCPICKTVVTEETYSICCTMCNTWVHQTCLHMDDDEFHILSQPEAVWYCAR